MDIVLIKLALIIFLITSIFGQTFSRRSYNYYDSEPSYKRHNSEHHRKLTGQESIRDLDAIDGENTGYEWQTSDLHDDRPRHYYQKAKDRSDSEEARLETAFGRSHRRHQNEPKIHIRPVSDNDDDATGLASPRHRSKSNVNNIASDYGDRPRSHHLQPRPHHKTSSQLRPHHRSKSPVLLEDNEKGDSIPHRKMMSIPPDGDDDEQQFDSTDDDPETQRPETQTTPATIADVEEEDSKIEQHFGGRHRPTKVDESHNKNSKVGHSAAQGGHRRPPVGHRHSQFDMHQQRCPSGAFPAGPCYAGCAVGHHCVRTQSWWHDRQRRCCPSNESSDGGDEAKSDLLVQSEINETRGVGANQNASFWFCSQLGCLSCVYGKCPSYSVLFEEQSNCERRCDSVNNPRYYCSSTYGQCRVCLPGQCPPTEPLWTSLGRCIQRCPESEGKYWWCSADDGCSSCTSFRCPQHPLFINQSICSQQCGSPALAYQESTRLSANARLVDVQLVLENQKLLLLSNATADPEALEQEEYEQDVISGSSSVAASNATRFEGDIGAKIANLSIVCEGSFEVAAECGVLCSCSNFKLYGNCRQSCTKKGGLHCFCQNDYLRDDVTGKCISIDDCRRPLDGSSQCGANEEFDICSANCQLSCGDVLRGDQSSRRMANKSSCASSPSCVPGCVCKEGFARDSKGSCLPIGDCLLTSVLSPSVPNAQSLVPVCDYVKCDHSKKQLCKVNRMRSAVCVPDVGQLQNCSSDNLDSLCHDAKLCDERCPVSSSAQCYAIRLSSDCPGGQRCPGGGDGGNSSGVWLDSSSLGEIDCFERCASIRCPRCQRCVVRMGRPVCEQDLADPNPNCVNLNPCEPNPCGPCESCEIIVEQRCTSTPCDNFRCLPDNRCSRCSNNAECPLGLECVRKRCYFDPR